MLRKRSRSRDCKQALMADCGGLSSPSETQRRPIFSSLFSSPRLFTGFASKGLTDSESLMSPTSILDSKPFSALRNPFWSDSSTPRTPKTENRLQLEKLESRGVGLGLVDALTDEKADSNACKPENRKVIFGSQLKIQIPPLPPSAVISPVDSPKSPADFGIKTRNSVVGSVSPGLSPSSARKSPFGSSNSGLENSNSPRVFSGLSISEMERSEDYTCVISYGPNPRTTHIFDDCIVESWSGPVQISSSRGQNGFFINRSLSYPSESFLSFCCTCKKNLGQGKDIYMYRGEKAFCSSECRDKEIMLEKARKIPECDDVYGISSS